MKKIFVLILLFPGWMALQAQLKTYLTLESGPYWSLIKVDDPGNTFQAVSVNSSITGLTIEQEVREGISVVTGLYYQPSKTGMRMDDKRRQQARMDAYTGLMIPLRLQYRLQPTEYPVSFTPRIGYIFSVNKSPDATFTNRSILSDPDGTAWSYLQTQGTEVPGGHLLELGMGIGLRFMGLWQASFNLSYLSGVLSKSVTSSTLAYTDQQGSSHIATYTTRGNGLFTTLSFHAPVSNIWQNRDYRIRSRIENSLYEGKDLERKGQFYAGAELGSLWRLFTVSNPAIGARPMEGRGLFRYANFHTGLYGGYMLTQELGVDLGFNYQRSSTFYSVMYDHEVDFVQEMRAPMYLEVPFRIRYFYDAFEERIFAVVYGGLSALTNFSSGGYDSPAGDFSYTDPATQSTVNGTVSSTAERVSRIRPVLRLGIGVEYLLPIDFLPIFATTYLNFMHGFIATEELNVSTSLTESPELSHILYNGSGWSLDIGVKIPMSFDDRQNCVRLTREKGDQGREKRTRKKKTREQ